MRFWDSSAVVPVVTKQVVTQGLEALLRGDRRTALWWGTPVECESAFWRQHREGVMTVAQVLEARAALEGWRSEADEIPPTGRVRDLAVRMLAVHPLRASDALQLAAAVAAWEGFGAPFSFVCLDRRLAAAAEREGLDVVPVP